MKNQQKYNTAAFLEEYRILKQLAAFEDNVPEDSAVPAPADTAGQFQLPDGLVSPFNPLVCEGDIRLLPQTERLTYGAVLKWDEQHALLIPFSRCENPATDQEMYIEDASERALHMRIYQLWNARTVNLAVLARSWLMDRLPEHDLVRLKQLLGHIWLKDKLEDDSILNRTGLPLLPGSDIRKSYLAEELDNFRALDEEDARQETCPLYLGNVSCLHIFQQAEEELQAAAGAETQSELYLLSDSGLRYLGTLDFEDFVRHPAGMQLPRFNWYSEQRPEGSVPWMSVLFRHRETGKMLGCGILTPLVSDAWETSLLYPVRAENTPEIRSPNEIQVILCGE